MSRDHANILCLSSDCYEHAGHLVSLGSLKVLDAVLRRFGQKWKCFSSLASASHVLRDVGKDLYKAWCAIHGDVAGLKYAKKLWPKVVGGRWNSCQEVLTRMKQIGGRSKLKPVLEEVLLAKNGSKTKETTDALENDIPPSCVDEISFEDTKVFQAKMGRWRRQTLDCISQALWWIIADVLRIAQLTVVHFSETWFHYCNRVDWFNSSHVAISGKIYSHC